MAVIDGGFEAANPGVKINRVTQPFNSYFTLLKSAVVAKKGPDIFLNYPGPATFDNYNVQVPLTSLVTPSQRADLIGWNLTSTGLKSAGTPYAVPFTGQGITFYYNKTLFTKAGLDPSQPPTTWQDFLADCAALKKAGITPIASGFEDGYYAEWWADVLSGEFMTDQQLADSYSNPNWESQPVAQGLSFLVQLHKLGYMTPNDGAINLFPDTVNAFGAGKAAIFLGLAADNANWSEFSKDEVSGQLGVFNAPILPGAVQTSERFDFGPAVTYAITTWSKAPTQAYAYLSYLSQPDVQAKLFTLTGGALPNNKLVDATSTDTSATTILGWVKSTPTYWGMFSAIRSGPEAAFDKVAPQFVLGQTSVASAMKQVQAAQQQTSPLPTS